MLKEFVIVVIFISLYSFISTWSSPNTNKSSSGYSRFEYIDEDPVDFKVTPDNWDCTDDCSGHEAGYDWASENGITDPSDCDGNSDSFIEGCEAYANEQEIQLESESEEYYEDNYSY